MVTTSVCFAVSHSISQTQQQQAQLPDLAPQILGGIADTVAQTLTAIRARRRRNMQIDKDISDGIEMPNYDEKIPYASEFMIPNRLSHSQPSFDFERLTRFMSYGFIMSPVQFQWFSFLSKTFPITKESATMPAMMQVGFDQLIFAPIGISPHLSSG